MRMSWFELDRNVLVRERLRLSLEIRGAYEKIPLFCRKTPRFFRRTSLFCPKLPCFAVQHVCFSSEHLCLRQNISVLPQHTSVMSRCLRFLPPSFRFWFLPIWFWCLPFTVLFQNKQFWECLSQVCSIPGCSIPTHHCLVTKQWSFTTEQRISQSERVRSSQKFTVLTQNFTVLT